MNPLNAYLALELMNDHIARAERHRRAHPARTRSRPAAYESVTIRRATAADRPVLEHLAELEGRPAPRSPALVAEVGGRILAARWIDDRVTLADPFVSTAELVALLDARARHLGAAPRLVSRPVRRALSALHLGHR